MNPPRIQGDDPVVLAGSLIKLNEVHLLSVGGKVPSRKPGVAGVKLYGAFGAYGILKRVVESSPGDYYKVLWARSAETTVSIGSCRYGDPLDDILEAYSVTRFGGARVTRGASEAIVTLADVSGLIARGKLSTHTSIEDVGSAPVVIAGNAPILQAIKMMISNNIRRLFLNGGREIFVSDRSLIDFMFTPERLETARDHPEMWIDGEVSSLPSKAPSGCGTGDLDEAARVLGLAPDDCLMTDGGRVISRWDLVVKPWKTGKLTATND